MLTTPAPHYSFEKYPFMKPLGPTMPVSDGYVCIPNALVINDSEGALWTLGFDRGAHWQCGEYEFDVIRNGVKTGENACRIEYGGNKIRIFGQDGGWRTWNGRTFI